MKTVQSLPPNYEEIVAALGRPPRNAVYAWGDTLYMPGGGIADPALMAHEQTHSRQQKRIGSPEEWWKRYLAEPAFRLAQEVEAYRNQYHLAARFLGRAERREYLRELANDLSGRMYGKLVRREVALQLIEGRP